MQNEMLEKVRALLAKAESTTYEAEADTFRDKALALMAKHVIDSALLSRDNETVRTIIRKTIKISAPYRYEQAMLWGGISDVFGVRSVQFQKKGERAPHSVELFGTETAIQMTETMVTSLMIQSLTLVNYVASDGAGYWADNAAATRKARRGWLAGFYTRTAARLSEMHTRAVEADSNGAALVLVSDAKRADDFLGEVYPRLRKARDRSYDAEAVRHGRAAGDRADLGVNSVGNSRRALNA